MQVSMLSNTAKLLYCIYKPDPIIAHFTITATVANRTSVPAPLWKQKHNLHSHSRKESSAMQVSHVINPVKLLILTHPPPNGPHVSHCLSCAHKAKQCWMSASMGVAEIDDANAVTTARTIAEEKRIVSEDVI
jgi:hypothetical protein